MIQIKNRSKEFHILFEIMRNLIISIGRTNYAWINNENNNSIFFSMEAVSKFDVISILFTNVIDPKYINFIGHNADEKVSINHFAKYVDDEFFFESNNLKDFNVLEVACSLEEWFLWKVHSYKLFGMEGGDVSFRNKVILFDSTEVFQKINELIDLLSKSGMEKDDSSYLEDLISGVLFNLNSVRSDSKSLDLYNDVCKSIVPYVPSAHGISLPLHRQGLRRITGNFNLISEKLNSLQMPWFCTSGTLLGFVREGQLISYDDDMDFVAYLGEFDCNANLRNEIDKFYEKNKNIISKGMNDLHYRLLNVGVSADLFLSWGDLNGNIYIYPWCSAQLGSSEIFPLDVINIEGHKFNIPRNPEACLKLNYGDQWRVPNPLWRFDWDKSNLLFKEFLF